MSEPIVTGIVIAIAVVAINWAIALLRRCWRLRRRARSWEQDRLAHHIIDTTPNPRGRKWP